MKIEINQYSGTAEAFVTRSEVEAEQDKTMCHTGPSVTRIRVLDEETGKHCWFVIGVQVKNGRPFIEVDCITSDKRKMVMGLFKAPINQ